MNDCQERLMERIKCAGQEIIDRAEEMAAVDLITSLSITIDLGSSEIGMDTIKWTTEAISKNNNLYFIKGE